MIKAIIVEDEEKSYISLKDDLKKFCPEVDVKGHAASVNDAFQLISTSKPELIFMDISIEGGNAFGLIEKLAVSYGSTENFPFEIIFTTAHNQFAVKALRLNALDYLLKPVDTSDLVNAVNKVNSRLDKKNSAIALRELLHNTRTTANEEKRIVLSVNGSYQVYLIKNIIRCESQRNYTEFHFADEKPLLVSKTLKDFEDILLEQGFERVHNSHIVNLAFIKKIIKSDGGYIELKDGTNIPLSPTKKDHLLDRLKKIQ